MDVCKGSTMTTLANALALAIFLAACFQARWVALALAPAVALILASWTGLVDLSSASHPARWLVPLVGAVLAGLAGSMAFIASKEAELEELRLIEDFLRLRREGTFIGSIADAKHNARVIAGVHVHAVAFLAALLVFGSDIVDLVALHPKIWEIPGVWAITPIQIIVCVSILVVLLAPERWIIWATRQTLEEHSFSIGHSQKSTLITCEPSTTRDA